MDRHDVSCFPQRWIDTLPEAGRKQARQGEDSSAAQIFSTRAGTPSGPVVFDGSSCLSSLAMVAGWKRTWLRAAVHRFGKAGRLDRWRSFLRLHFVEKICQSTRPCLCWLCAPVPGRLVSLGCCTDDRPHQRLSAWTTLAYSSLTLVEGGIEPGRFRVFWRCEGR